MSDNLTRIGQSEMSEIIKLRGPEIGTWALALMTVCLRFTARQLSKEKFWYDDCIILLATRTAKAVISSSYVPQLFATALCFSYAIWKSATPTTKLESFRKAVVVSEICWAVAIGLVKFSILAFYWRVFIQQSQTRATAVTIWFLTAIVACWGIATILLELLCDPSSLHLGFTDCHINSGRFFVGSSIPHVITDVVLLGFPVPHIWNLPMFRRPQKAYLTAVFAAGILVTIVSVVRLIYLITIYGFDGHGSNTNHRVPYTSIFILTNLETNLSIICGYFLSLLACIPCLRPILSLISNQLTLLRNRKSTHKRGIELLINILPADKTAPPSTSPLSRQKRREDGHRPVLELLTDAELEANTTQILELGAEALEPQIQEVETVEIHEMRSNHPPVAELDGWRRSQAMSEGRRG